MRLFVAVRPPTVAIDHLMRAVEPLRGESDRSVRWVRSPAWHFTLAFLGNVDETTAGRLRPRLGRAAARHAPFELAMSGAGRFGQRVLWIGVGGERRAVVALAQSVTAAARREHIPVDDRPYRPHLTIARGQPGADLRPAVDALGAYDGPPWTVEHLELVESRLGQGAGGTAEHVVVERWPLGAAPRG
jgi:2'-5' RNA ligase